MASKKWYQSKTQWFNMAAVIATGILNSGVVEVGVAASSVNPYVVVAVPLINMGLRAITKKAIKR